MIVYLLRPLRLSIAILGLTLLAAASPPVTDAQVQDVRLTLPQPSKLDLTGRRTVLPAPFLLPAEDGEVTHAADLELQQELARFVRRVLRRESGLDVLPAPPLDYPTWDPDALARDRDFWRAVGERTGADLILFGGIDLDMLQRTGYRNEDYVGPDGRLVRRQILVEQAGVTADVALYVIDGRTGEVLYRESFRDFAEAGDDDRSVGRAEASAMSPKDLFRRLAALEERLTGLFAEHTRETERTLYGG